MDNLENPAVANSHRIREIFPALIGTTEPMRFSEDEAMTFTFAATPMTKFSLGRIFLLQQIFLDHFGAVLPVASAAKNQISLSVAALNEESRNLLPDFLVKHTQYFDALRIARVKYRQNICDIAPIAPDETENRRDSLRSTAP